MSRINEFVRKNPVRIAALVSSLVAIVVTWVNPNLPVDSAIIFVLSALGLGEYAQRVEDRKTTDAFNADRRRKRTGE
jgi:hypothetical protein